MAPLYCLLSLIILTRCFVSARKWHDTGVGTIIFEEAWTVPELITQVPDNIAALGGTNAELKSNLLDVHNQRLTFMNENNVDFMVLSCAEPCIQGFSNPIQAANLAAKVNNQLAQLISNNTERFGGFASLAMHNATVAATELKRAVTELGFLGALLNDYQQSGPDNETLLFYDQPEYDVFWQMVTDLDVPIYFHPRSNIAQITNLEYRHSPFLLGPAQQYTVTLSSHILGLCTNGVFDRFPKLNIIVGHLGERIPLDFFRIDELTLIVNIELRRQIPNGMPMLRNASSYWQTNIFETTSGNFATALLKFHIDQIGIDRIMFSVDYPYVSIPEGAAWVDSLADILDEKDLNSLRRGLAIKMLRLNE